MNRIGNRKVQTTNLIRACLLGTKSIARHGRASTDLKAARAKLARLLKIPTHLRNVEAVCAAAKAHDDACRAMGMEGRPAAGIPLHP
jgi:hypothetical protein